MATAITFLATKLVQSLSSDTSPGLGQVSGLASGTLRVAASILNKAADKLSSDTDKAETDYSSEDVVDYRVVLSDSDSQNQNKGCPVLSDSQNPKKCSKSISIGSGLKTVYSRICDDLMYDDDEDEPTDTNCSVLSSDSGLGDIASGLADIELEAGDNELNEKEAEDEDFGNPEGLPEFSLDEVSDHCYENDAWMVIYNKVYDVTDFIQQHPGGDSVMLENIGYDGTSAFHGVGHSRDALEMLDDYLIGILPASQRIRSYIPNTPHSVPGCW